MRWLRGLPGLCRRPHYPDYSGGLLGSCAKKLLRLPRTIPRTGGWLLRQIQHLLPLRSAPARTSGRPRLRAARRAHQSRPIVERLQRALVRLKSSGRHLPQSLLGQAIDYALGQWTTLEIYLGDGRIEIDNNLSTAKQIEANRQNALKSTGPTSAVGKVVSSRNSTRHGFYTVSVLLPDEQQDEFIRLARRLVMHYAPCSLIEDEQVRTIIETRWQLRRANLVDTELYQIYGFYEGQQRGVGTAFAQDATQGNAFTKLTRYQTFLMRKFQVSERELQRLQLERATVNVTSTLSTRACD
jgi:hypothetical protein